MGKKTLRASLMFLLILSVCGLSMNMMRISKAQENHDVAVFNVTPPGISVMSGELVTITVSVGNQGMETETFDVTLYHDTVTIETKTVVDLAADQNTTLIFAWDTSDTIQEIYSLDAKEKTYDISAVATLTSDTDQDDNSAHAEVMVMSQYIAVVPQRTVNTTITSGMNYTVAIYTDYNGSDVWGWQFALSYNPVSLEGVEVRNGDLINTARHPNATFMAGSFNNTKGELSMTAALIEYQVPPAPTLSGPGTLAYVTFRVKETGESNITFVERQTKLFRPDAEEIINYFLPSLGHLLYGSFSNTKTKIIRDIAVLSVTPSPTVVTQGQIVDIAVVVENQGTVAEVFDVILYYDYNPPTYTPTIGQPQKVLGLASNTQKNLSFTWNTTTLRPKSYTVTAVVPQISGETHTTDNKLQSSQTVTVEARELRPLPITEILIVIVVVVAIIAAVVILRRRRRKPIPE